MTIALGKFTKDENDLLDIDKGRRIGERGISSFVD